MNRTNVRRKLMFVALAALISVMAAGCGFGGGDDESSNEGPKLISVSDLRDHPRGSPEAAVIRHFFFIQWGSARNLIGSLDRRITRTVGIPDLIDAYAFLRPGLAAAKFRLVGKLQSEEGPLILYEIVPEKGASQTESMLLRKVGSDYIIAYDTLLDRGIPGSIRGAAAEEPESVQRNRRVVRRIEAVRRRYHAAAGAPALRSVRDADSGDAEDRSTEQQVETRRPERQPPATTPSP